MCRRVTGAHASSRWHTPVDCTIPGAILTGRDQRVDALDATFNNRLTRLNLHPLHPLDFANVCSILTGKNALLASVDSSNKRLIH
jgi:hypothetical protein